MDPIKDGGADVEGTPIEAPKTDDSAERTYSKAEIDRRVTEALKKAEEKQQAAIKAERERLEAEKLREQGEFKTLHEKAATELETLRKELAAKEHREAVSAAIREAGLTDFEAVLTSDRTKPEDYVAAGKTLQDTVKKLADAEVARRLDTGPPKVTTTTTDARQRGVFVYPSMAAK